MKSKKLIDQKSQNRVKQNLEELVEFSKPFLTLRDTLGATAWTPDYIQDLRVSNPDPKYLAQVEKFSNARNAYISAIKGNKTTKAKPLKALAYKAFATCFSEIGKEDKADEMKKKYAEIRERYILG
jgi:hypothetical protein